MVSRGWGTAVSDADHQGIGSSMRVKFQIMQISICTYTSQVLLPNRMIRTNNDFLSISEVQLYFYRFFTFTHCWQECFLIRFQFFPIFLAVFCDLSHYLSWRILYMLIKKKSMFLCFPMTCSIAVSQSICLGCNSTLLFLCRFSV